MAADRTSYDPCVKSSARSLCVAITLVTLAAGSAHALGARDPAGIEGAWEYRTRSNCGSVEGVGKVAFVWNEGTRTYRETGWVYWADSGTTIRWWGPTTLSSDGRHLRGRIENSLGDHVDGHWEVDGSPANRLIVRWNQTNGCHGTGIATRKPPGTPE
jgi:hypothetical protein